MQPDLAYFTDPSQNFISDYFQALTQAGTSIGSVQGESSEAQQMDDHYIYQDGSALGREAFPGKASRVEPWGCKGLAGCAAERPD